MNIIILNGNSDISNYAFDRYIEYYRVKINKTGHYVRSYMLRDMKINDFILNGTRDDRENKDCVEDDFRYISNNLYETDLIVLASPLEQGFISVLSKMVNNRLSQVLIPPENTPSAMLKRSQGIPKIPLMGLIMQKEPDTSEQDLLLNRLTCERMAANMHTILSFCVTTDNGITETVRNTFQGIDYRTLIEQTCNE